MNTDFFIALFEAFAWSLLGIVLMALGFIVVDLLTPGKLADVIWKERNRAASYLLASNLLGVGLINVGAIIASPNQLGWGLVSAFGYSVVGLIAMSAAFLLLDLFTPGKLGHILFDKDLHPAVWVSCAMHVAIGGVICTALI